MKTDKQTYTQTDRQTDRQSDDWVVRFSTEESTSVTVYSFLSLYLT